LGRLDLELTEGRGLFAFEPLSGLEAGLPFLARPVDLVLEAQTALQLQEQLLLLVLELGLAALEPPLQLASRFLQLVALRLSGQKEKIDTVSFICITTELSGPYMT
jgi:hypothetical protein